MQPLAKRVHDGPEGNTIESADFPLGIGEEPHDWVVLVVEDYGVRNVQNNLWGVFLGAGLQSKQLEELQKRLQRLRRVLILLGVDLLLRVRVGNILHDLGLLFKLLH